MYGRVVVPLLISISALGPFAGIVFVAYLDEYGPGAPGTGGWLVAIAVAAVWLISAVLAIRYDDEHGQGGSGGIAGGP